MSKKNNDEYIYLDTYVLQKDMRIRLPKTVEQNMKIIKGETEFDILLKSDRSEIILKIHNSDIVGDDL